MKAALVAVLALAVAAGCDPVPPPTPTPRPSPAESAPTARVVPSPPVPVTGHPRLLVTEADLPRLRSWVTSDNPVYADGLSVLVADALAEVERGLVPGADGGSDAYEEYPVEVYAELFAFMSLIAPDDATRADFGRRARDLFMYFIGRAEPGPGADDEPFRDPEFSTYDRSRWQGEAWGLTVDWAYPYFSADDKARIRGVFLRWAGEQFDSYPVNGLDGVVPGPDGPFNDPSLLANPESVRYALNNYYIGHTRNLGLMALALDPEDDPGGELRVYLDGTLRGYLYVIDHALRTQAAGGLDPEGFQYGPDSLGRLLTLLVALHSAGEDDPAKWGPQVVLAGNPFWADFIPGILHSLPQSPISGGDGRVWQPAIFGSAELYGAPDFISSLGPLALHARSVRDDQVLNAIRWIETNVAPGGPDEFPERVGNTDDFFSSILYFLTFEPGSAAPTDPRPGLPLAHVAEGLDRILARTCWCEDARWFTYGIEWKAIDHQRGDGNDFGFYRNGEWLTKQRTGYSSGGSFSDYHNTLTIENNPLLDGSDERFIEAARRGDQFPGEPAADPILMAHSETAEFVYAAGDATGLYNATIEGIDDVRHVSRSIVWLAPDVVVIYDRAETATSGRFKRFWLQLPAAAEISGNVARVQTAGGQQLFSTTLLPSDARLTSEADEPEVGDPTDEDPMAFRLRVEAPGGPARVRFLHVLQGADAAAAREAPAHVQSSSGTAFEGVAAAGWLVLFPVDLGDVASVTATIPNGVGRVLVTGLEPGARYSVTVEGQSVAITPGGDTVADEGGVLVIRSN